MVHARRTWGPGWWRASFSLIHIRRKEMLRFGVSTNLTGTLTLLSRDSEILWLGALASPLAAGYYKVSLAILNILLIPVQPLISTTYRELTREVGARAWENVRYLLKSGSIIAMAYSIPAAIFLIVLGPWVVSLWGAEFLPQSYQALLILLIGVTFVNIFYWNRTTLLPLGLPEFPTKVTLVAAVIKVVAILILVPRPVGIRRPGRGPRGFSRRQRLCRPGRRGTVQPGARCRRLCGQHHCCIQWHTGQGREIDHHE